jgi:hypothetical protein
MMANMPGLQRHLCINNGNPIQQGQQRQLNDSKEACALMMVMTPLLRGQQRQLDDYATLTTAEMSLQQGQ